MAVIETLTTYESLHHQKLNWTGFAISGDTSPVSTIEKLPDYHDRSVAIQGTFTGALEITIEGSNDGGVTWHILNDAFGVALVKTSAGLFAITEVPEQIRGRASAGSGGATVDVHLFMRGRQ